MKILIVPHIIDTEVDKPIYEYPKEEVTDGNKLFYYFKDGELFCVANKYTTTELTSIDYSDPLGFVRTKNDTTFEVYDKYIASKENLYALLNNQNDIDGFLKIDKIINQNSNNTCNETENNNND